MNEIYLVDAINFQDYAYDLTQGLLGKPVPVTADVRAESQRVIREQVDDLAKFYRFNASDR